MSRNEKLIVGLAGGLAMGVVARQLVASNGKALGLSPAELVLLGLVATALVTPVITKAGRR